MKVTFQIEHLDPARGGQETYVDLFARRLVAAGWGVRIVTGRAADPPPGAEVCELPRWTPETARDFCAERPAGIVVGVGRSAGVHVFQPHGGTFAGSRRQNLLLLRNPVNRWVRGLLNRILPKHRRAARLDAEQYSQASPRPRFVAISRMVRDDMTAFHAVPADRTHLIYNGVDGERFAPEKLEPLRAAARAAWGLGAGTTCLLTVAHNFRLKGVRELIEAAALVRRHDRDFRIVIVGKERPGPWERLALRHGCGDVVRFAGPMRDVLPAYAAADAYLQPTWYDPCSLVVLEAWACGLPVVTTRFNGAGELMTPGTEGLLIDRPDDTDGLAGAMVRLLDPGVRRSMGAAGRVLAGRHTLERNFDEMTAVFRLAAAEAGTG